MSTPGKALDEALGELATKKDLLATKQDLLDAMAANNQFLLTEMDKRFTDQAKYLVAKAAENKRSVI